MLVIRRRPLESIVIDTPSGPVTIMVLEIRGDKVRLGFQAAKDIPIWREELMGKGKAAS